MDYLESLQEEDYAPQFEDLINSLISSVITKDNPLYEQQAEKIREIYMFVMKNQLGSHPPKFATIIDNIIQENYDIIMQLANLDMIHGDDCPEYSHYDIVPLFFHQSDEDEVGAWFDAYVSAWYEEYAPEFRYEMPHFVYTVLNDMRLCFSLSGWDSRPVRCLEKLREDVTVTLNDAQNLLFEEWHLNLMLCGEEDYFLTEEDIKILMGTRFCLLKEG